MHSIATRTMALKDADSTDHSQNLDVLRAIAVMLILVEHVLETIGHKTG